MSNHITSPTQDELKKQEILNHIRKGMTIYDNEQNRVGTVDTVYMGEANKETAGTELPATTSATGEESGTLAEEVANIFDPRDKVPAELAERLRYNGYIKIDGGWFGADRYVLPKQIASVSDEGVYLTADHGTPVKA